MKAINELCTSVICGVIIGVAFGRIYQLEWWQVILFIMGLSSFLAVVFTSFRNDDK